MPKNWKFEFTTNWINNIPKIIDNNGCWIPLEHKAGTQGYVTIKINYIEYKLHRLSMCIHLNLDYYDKKLDTRHSKNCDRACFNYEHLQPGTTSDNQKDSVLHGTHKETRKLVCPKCGSNYKTYTRKSGWSKGQTKRYCPLAYYH
jgi:hypothetical protein